MRLSSKEATILAAAELRPDASLQVLQRDTGYRGHTIRYALQRLREKGIFKPVPFVNIHRLGFNIVNIFFSIGAQKRQQKDALLESFLNTPEIIWVGEFGGEYQYGIAISCRRIAEAVELVNRLSKKHGTVFFEKAVSYQHAVTVYPRRYLVSKRFPIKPLVSRGGGDVVALDALDERLLNAFVTLGDPSHRELAQELSIPPSTVDLRMRKLRQKGIICGSVSALDPALIGVQSYKLLLFVKGVHPEFSAELHRFALSNRRVTYVIECLGGWDYELGVESERPEEVTEVIQLLYEEFGPQITTIKLLTKFGDFKNRWFPGGNKDQAGKR